MAKKKSLRPKYQIWIEARKCFHLSYAHIQMSRELGMNPEKFGKLSNNRQEPWKEPLFWKRFKNDRPDNVRSIEQMVRDAKRKRAERKARKQRERDSQQNAGKSERSADGVSECQLKGDLVIVSGRTFDEIVPFQLFAPQVICPLPEIIPQTFEHIEDNGTDCSMRSLC